MDHCDYHGYQGLAVMEMFVFTMHLLKASFAQWFKVFIDLFFVGPGV